jgi:hypothetical protein
MDPIGLALENFDGIGAFRTQENGAAIDASGELDGAHFANAKDLGKAIHDNPAAASCLVDTLAKYAGGQAPAKGDREWMQWLNGRFVAEGYRVPALLRTLALSNGFYSIAAPGKPTGLSTAALRPEDQR